MTFDSNSAKYGGGGLSNHYYSHPILQNVTFSNNTASVGAGVYNNRSSPGLTNVTFYSNIASSAGGGMTNVLQSNPTLTNVTIHRNQAPYPFGGAMYNNSASNPVIRNSILYLNYGGVFRSDSSTPYVTYSIVQGGYPGTGNIDADPLLGPLQGNGGFTQTIALLTGSPAIDAGNDAICPPTDQRGVTRPQGSSCDIGAYEADSSLVVTKTTDTNDGVCDSDCSLREAIGVAENGGIITFANSLSGQTITLDSELVIGKSMTIDGSALTSKIQVSGNNSVRVFKIESSTTVTLDSILIENGYSATNGGGIFNGGTLTLRDSVLSGNSTDQIGGGVFNTNMVAGTSTGILTVINSTFMNNSAASAGGIMSGDGPLTVRGSTFVNNSTVYNGGAIAVFNDVAVVENSTFVGNTADHGGAIANSIGFLTLANSTLSNNSANYGAGVYNEGALKIANNIIANSVSGSDCYNEEAALIQLNVNNLVDFNAPEPFNCGTPALTVDPLLGPLQNNGGFTQTMALGVGSPAIDAGDNAICPAADQRGVTRPQGAQCDIGAYEYTGPIGDVVPPVVVSVTRADTDPTMASQVDFHVTFSEDVTGVDASDFSLTTSGVSGAAINAVSASGNLYTVSVDRGSGAGTIRLDVVDDDSIVDAASNPLGGVGLENGDFDLGEFYTVPQVVTLNLNSVAANDGWVLESSETSNLGGAFNATSSSFNVGDDKANRQFVGILHFDTSSLPDNAVITSVTLQVRKQGLTGTDPFTTHGGLVLDIQQPYFGTTAGMLLSDFEATPGVAAVSTFDPTPVNNWYSAIVDSAGYAYVDLTGTTQFRLRFTLDDDNDRSGDAIMFYSGEAAAVKGTTATNRPQLIIQYYIP